MKLLCRQLATPVAPRHLLVQDRAQHVQRLLEVVSLRRPAPVSVRHQEPGSVAKVRRVAYDVEVPAEGGSVVLRLTSRPGAPAQATTEEGRAERRGEREEEGSAASGQQAPGVGPDQPAQVEESPRLQPAGPRGASARWWRAWRRRWGSREAPPKEGSPGLAAARFFLGRQRSVAPGWSTGSLTDRSFSCRSPLGAPGGKGTGP